MAIKETLLELEKYSTSKDKKTYIMIPYDHPVYEFPYNLEDRAEYIKEEIYNYTKSSPKINITKKDKSYEISISENEIKDNSFLKKLKFELKGNKWIRVIN